MVKRQGRWSALGIAIGLAGCNDLAGIHEGTYDPCVEDAGSELCLATGSGGARSGPSTGVTTGTTTTATTAGVGGSRDPCGDGTLDPGEECDDRNEKDGDGCTHCKVDCTEAGAFKDPVSAHCYWVLPAGTDFFQSSVLCQSHAGGQLAAVTSASELSFISSRVYGPVWIGASALGPMEMLGWLDGEPWAFYDWGGGEPALGGKNLCVVLRGQPLEFWMDDCALSRAALCERNTVPER